MTSHVIMHIGLLFCYEQGGFYRGWIVGQYLAFDPVF